MPRLIASPTAHQQAIFAHIQTGARNLIVQAVAGSGKTSTIVHAMSLLPQNVDAVYLVFNKKNQLEAAKRLEGTPVIASTFNSYGMKALPKIRGRWDLQSDKAMICWRELVTFLRLSKEEDRAFGMFAVNMVSKARAAGIGVVCEDEPSVWEALADHHDVAPQGEIEGRPASLRRGIVLAQKLLARMIDAAKKAKLIDFDDQIYLPLHPDFGGNIPRPDWIFVDEAQDLSPIQVEFVARMMGAEPGQPVPQDSSAADEFGFDAEDGEAPRSGQRCVFVGDRWQAIYGWRGADCDAMDNIRDRFGCDELPLSVCFRCASDFVELAANLGAQIEAAPGAPKGELVNWSSDDGGYTVPEGTVVLCRTTAPLVSAAYGLIRKGRRAVVLGRDIGKGLVSLVRQMKARGLADLTEKLEQWSLREIERLEGKEHKQEAIRDKVDCILVMCELLPAGEDSVEDLIRKIEGLFYDPKDGETVRGVTFSTVHKAKGLEWDEVTILDAHKMPAQWAKKDWQKKQEVHVAYVAYTRPKHRLVLVKSEDFERDDRTARVTRRGQSVAVGG